MFVLLRRNYSTVQSFPQKPPLSDKYIMVSLSPDCTTQQQFINTDADSGHEGVLCAGQMKPPEIRQRGGGITIYHHRSSLRGSQSSVDDVLIRANGW